MCPPHFLGGGAPVDFGGGAGRGGTVLLASLGSLTHWLALHARGLGRRWGVSAVLVGASVDVCSGDGIAEGGQRRLLHLARVGAGPLMRRFALHTRGPGRR